MHAERPNLATWFKKLVETTSHSFLHRLRSIMSRPVLLFLTFLLIGGLLSGCYSTRVSTPREPNGQKIEKPFATGFLYGLATPGAHFYAERCKHGMARMETKYSFLNMLASNLTFGLYTPMHVEVYCAESPAESSAWRTPSDTTSSLDPYSTKKE